MTIQTGQHPTGPATGQITMHTAPAPAVAHPAISPADEAPAIPHNSEIPHVIPPETLPPITDEEREVPLEALRVMVSLAEASVDSYSKEALQAEFPDRPSADATVPNDEIDLPMVIDTSLMGDVAEVVSAVDTAAHETSHSSHTVMQRCVDDLDKKMTTDLTTTVTTGFKKMDTLEENLTAKFHALQQQLVDLLNDGLTTIKDEKKGVIDVVVKAKDVQGDLERHITNGNNTVATARKQQTDLDKSIASSAEALKNNQRQVDSAKQACNDARSLVNDAKTATTKSAARKNETKQMCTDIFKKVTDKEEALEAKFGLFNEAHWKLASAQETLQLDINKTIEEADEATRQAAESAAQAAALAEAAFASSSQALHRRSAAASSIDIAATQARLEKRAQELIGQLEACSPGEATEEHMRQLDAKAEAL